MNTNTIERGFTALGEIQSEEDGQFIGETLQQLGIPFEMFHGGSRVDELRRFFGEWHEGVQLIVRSQDEDRARSAVGDRIFPLQVWADELHYLGQCSNEQLFKLLDFHPIWQEPVTSAVAHMLATRGAVYPPDGTCSRYTPALYTIIPACLGPFGSLILPSVNKSRRTAEGGTRPRYDEKARLLLERCRKRGLIIWCVLLLTAILVLKAMIPV